MEPKLTQPRKIKGRFVAVVLTLVLSSTMALVAVIVLGLLIPGIYGSSFEGSSGYVAMFIFWPVLSLMLLPIAWRLSKCIRHDWRVVALLLMFSVIAPYLLSLPWWLGTMPLAWLGFRLLFKSRESGGP